MIHKGSKVKTRHKIKKTDTINSRYKSQHQQGSKRQFRTIKFSLNDHQGLFQLQSSRVRMIPLKWMLEKKEWKWHLGLLKKILHGDILVCFCYFFLWYNWVPVSLWNDLWTKKLWLKLWPAMFQQLGFPFTQISYFEKWLPCQAGKILHSWMMGNVGASAIVKTKS